MTALPDTRVTVLPDGRDLAWLELGVPAGRPVMAFHGTPGSRLQLAMADAPARAGGVRLIVPDRPGYGLSTFQPYRQLPDWADDVRYLADHLGLDRFAVLGVSGGGPHAAACARFLPDRVSAAAVVSGVAPLSEPGSEKGMATVEQLSIRLTRRWPAAVLPLLAAVTRAARRRPDRVIAVMRRTLSPADGAVLARPEVRAGFRADLGRAARTSARAAVQDYALFTRDWGFRLEDIAVPVHLWHGDADRDVPVSQGRFQAGAIPGAVLHECPGEGHLLAATRLPEILGVISPGPGPA